MLKKIIKWIERFQLKRKVKRIKVQPKGFSLLNYLIRRYLNEYEEYDAEFEKIIDTIYDPEQGTREYLIGTFIVNLFCLMEADSREIWYNLINDNEIKEQLRKIVDKSVKK
ncbi:MAG: hypothetical protein IKV87_02840 [Methanobrevibacter sp.]|nr:hypothetical protein [Methanobrevibacter sp.]